VNSVVPDEEGQKQANQTMNETAKNDEDLEEGEL